MTISLNFCAYLSVDQFQLFDSDSDNIVNEAESKLILDSMVETQKAVLAEIFALHVRTPLPLVFVPRWSADVNGAS